MTHIWARVGLQGAAPHDRAPDSLARSFEYEVSLPGGLLGAHGGARWWEGDNGAVAVAGRCRHATSGREWGPETAAALLEAYRRRGPSACSELYGSFALVLVDGCTGEALLAVDRLGTRPLFYAETGDGVVASTRLYDVIAHPDVCAETDAQALYDYLYFHVVPAPRTIYRAVKRLLPGEALIVEQRGRHRQTLWQPHYREDIGLSSQAAARELRERLHAAVRRALDGRAAGAFLSGGADSSTLLGVLGEVTGARPRAFSIGFDAAAGYDETRYARAAAAHFAADHHQYFVTPEDVTAALPEIARGYDQPFGNASAVPAYYCARLAREAGVELLLGGDGGDELFGGNTRYGKQWLFSLYDELPAALRTGSFERIAGHIAACSGFGKVASYLRQARTPMPDRMESYNLLRRLGAEPVLHPDFLCSVEQHEPLILIQDAYRMARARSTVNRMLARDLRFTLADNDLIKVRGACALAGMDVAFPFLDDELVEFSLRLPPRWKVDRWRLRPFFKKALHDFLPPAVLRKRKRGFGLPFGVWLANDAGLRSMAAENLSGLQNRGILRRGFADELLSHRLVEHAGYYGTLVWVLVMLEQWHRTRVQSAAPPAERVALR